jgi:hypothetical protein
MLVYFMSIWYTYLQPLGIFYGYQVYFSRFGMLQQEKSGNPEEWTEGNWTNEPGLPGCWEAGR